MEEKSVRIKAVERCHNLQGRVQTMKAEMGVMAAALERFQERETLWLQHEAAGRSATSEAKEHATNLKSTKEKLAQTQHELAEQKIKTAKYKRKVCRHPFLCATRN